MKKKKVNPNDLKQFVLSRNEFETLRHFLGPLELAVFENKFQPFDYKFENVIFHIDRQTGTLLVEEIKRRIVFSLSVVRRERVKLAFNDTKKLLFLSSNIDKHGFSDNLVKKLNYKGILKMDQLALIGRENLRRQNRIDKVDFEQLVAVFEKYGCEDIF